MKIKVGVIFGGPSVEHEVSIISALQAIENIDKEKYEVVPIYITKDRAWYTGKQLFKIENYKNMDKLLKKCKQICLCRINNEFCIMEISGIIKKNISKIDIAFPIVHGKNVEDGTLIGLLTTLGIPFVGSEVLGSAVGQDKVILKQILETNKIPVVDYIWFYDNEYLNEKKIIKQKIRKLGYPVIVKPACLGSSIGINYVNDESNIDEAIEEAIEYDRKVLVEKAIDNFVELNCSVLGDYKKQDTSLIEQVMSQNNILTYTDKYLGDGKSKGCSKGMLNTSRIIPANVPSNITEEVYKLSKLTFKVLNLSGICRIDFLVDVKSNQVYVNEPNIIPGSLSFYLWEPQGKKYTQLLTELIELGINNYKNSIKKTNSYNTSLLNEFNQNNGLKYK